MKKSNRALPSGDAAGPGIEFSKRTADSGLVKEVASRLADVVKSQIANVVTSALFLSATTQLEYIGKKHVEMMSSNNEVVPPDQDAPDLLRSANNYTSEVRVGETLKGLKKIVCRLSAFIGISAATDMLRLSNSYFFSLLENSGM